MTTSMVADKNPILLEDSDSEENNLFPFADKEATKAAVKAAKEEASQWLEDIDKSELLKPLVFRALTSFIESTLEQHTSVPTTLSIRIVANAMKKREKQV
jgi:hypothetical protein